LRCQQEQGLQTAAILSTTERNGDDARNSQECGTARNVGMLEKEGKANKSKAILSRIKIKFGLCS
jgi:hypothetical protein